MDGRSGCSTWPGKCGNKRNETLIMSIINIIMVVTKRMKALTWSAGVLVSFTAALFIINFASALDQPLALDCTNTPVIGAFYRNDQDNVFPSKNRSTYKCVAEVAWSGSRPILSFHREETTNDDRTFGGIAKLHDTSKSIPRAGDVNVSVCSFMMTWPDTTDPSAISTNGNCFGCRRDTSKDQRREIASTMRKGIQEPSELL
uniref:Uncharacterized protein n=1 Tax=Anopheles maculatus TaxID=74869 RepID=A0A182SBQ3_9DIPT